MDKEKLIENLKKKIHILKKERLLTTGELDLLLTSLTAPVDGKDIIQLEAERMLWSFENFPEATALSSLNKLREEIKEVEQELNYVTAPGALFEEYADCLMCLFDSAGRTGITPQEIFKAFAIKMDKNKKRTWKKNPDNTYSHY